MWHQHREPNHEVLRNLSRHFHRLGRTNPACFPLFLGDAVFVATDSSGAHKGSDFDVLSLLYFDDRAFGEWDIRRLALRSRYFVDNRRMSYKHLGDSQRRSALLDFLKAADQLPGLLISAAVDKRLKLLLTEKDDVTEMTREMGLAAR